MRWLLNPDIRQRLWIALALLAASTMFVGGIAWYALDRAGSRLEQLHSQTLIQVARALSLSKQSSDIATTAPFLLNLRSSYLIEREGRLLLEVLEPVLTAWPANELESQSPVYAFEPEIAAVVYQMKMAILDLVAAAERLNSERDVTSGLNVRLSRLEAQSYHHATDPVLDNFGRRNWLSLQRMANELAGAGHAENLLGVGERRRNFQRMRRAFANTAATQIQLDMYQELEKISTGSAGLFEVRRRELSRRLESQNALFRIQYHASTISDLAAQFANNAEEFLSVERQKTATSIDFAKAAILIVGLGAVVIALLSSVFVSGYVTSNIKAISDAMLRLAQGDRSTQLHRKPVADDEIGKLHHSFRVFRANALRLDRSNRQLHQKNALFEKTFANISEGVAITSDTGQLTAANLNFAAVLRLDTGLLLGKTTICDLMAHTEFAAQAVEAGIDSHFRGFTELENAEGQSLEIRCSRLPDGGGIWLFSDATERREMDNRLRQIQHIESLGQVTGEVAHDFGNVLSAITANIHLLQTGSRKVSSKTLLHRVANAAELGTSLTQRLLTFARKQRLVPEVVELNELINGLCDLVSIGLKPEVKLQAVASVEKLYVRVDPGQLESAILNLCLNANQAIEGAGFIHISVAKSSATTASIDITDTGCGMEDTVVARSPEPFFTARKDGQGTGLGLSMVYGFIKQTGGDIQISSAVGQGTTVRLMLPLSQNQIDCAPARSMGRALLVEDDPIALASTSQQLVEIGYRVIEATSFAEAEKALYGGQKLDLLVTDLHLDQGHSGWTIVRNCLSLCSTTQIIVASGRMPGTHPYSDGQEPRVTCLEKPLSTEDLRSALNMSSARSVVRV